MCGLAGIWGTSAAGAIESMLGVLAHRGPDDSKVVDLNGSGTLGHCRLAIIDPRGGCQPIANEKHSSRIITNGEIYNFRELRSDLEKRHTFQSGSDGESALHLFEEVGPSMVHKLDGMFALAIAHEDGLFIARDPLGIKPLYYAEEKNCESNSSLLFASEMKAVARPGRTVREFPPGTAYDSRQGFLPYYRVPAPAPRKLPLNMLRRLLRETIENSVEKRLVSDVPLGVFLSGGLDSSIIAAIAARHLRPLHTFAVGLEGSADLEAARVVARHIGSRHHEYELDQGEIARDLSKIIYHLESFDQDLVRSAIPCFYCSHLASQHVKVVLTGEGADELFAGYEYHKRIPGPLLLHEELRRSLGTLHNINLQRVDRMTMAHGIEGRVPFLDLDLVELAQRIPAGLKLRHHDDGTITEKWILRTVAEDLLPPEIVWRRKAQFDEGSGVVNALRAVLDRLDSPDDHRVDCRQSTLPRTREESVYHRMLSNVFGDASGSIISNTARWSEGRIDDRKAGTARS